MNLSSLELGSFKITGLRDGFFYLDGGAMFGVVPKVLWEKLMPADGQNRIKLGLNSLLVQTPEANVLIETGIGENLPEKFRKYYSLEREPDLLTNLEKIGVTPEDIDFVINTHLHFDHCGGNTRQDKSGNFVPTFPRAKYIIQQGEWEYALSPSPRDKPSYLAFTFQPLAEGESLQLVKGLFTVCPGVEVVPIPGHTRHHQCIRIKAGGRTVFFLGDLVPTRAHIGLSYVMSYDLFPLETINNKQKIFEQGIREKWIFAFNHDPDYFFGQVIKQNDRFHFSPLSD
ncbi:MBL fold metallo-hydrolase [Candidatus Aminicenantes bacterium AC-334-K16]|jgi:glyoxylase-like metal-dependent hydrolase (beta-lactamase superfamily II)|nr:MBL fold metallo-hydrolase [Candidatus Aminicenantes bacterium AC-334-K16]